jgi:hypothetical protein
MICYDRALTSVKIGWFTSKDFDQKADPRLVQIAMTVAETLGPTLRQFIGLGLKREWKRAGQSLFQAGAPATDIYVVVSGRVRINGKNHRRGPRVVKKRSDSDAATGARDGLSMSDEIRLEVYTLPCHPPLSSVLIAKLSHCAYRCI